VTIEKGELATSVKEKKKEVKTVKTKFIYLGMTNYFTDSFYLWCVG